MVDRTADFLDAAANHASYERKHSHVEARQTMAKPQLFTNEAGLLVASISRMERFLRKTFSKYVNPLSIDSLYERLPSTGQPRASLTLTAEHNGSKLSTLMQDSDREEFDKTMEKFAKRCANSLNEMRGHAEAVPAISEQQQEHRRLVARYLESRVFQLVNVWQKMSSLRAKELMRTTVNFEMGISIDMERHNGDFFNANSDDESLLRRRRRRRERREMRQRSLRASKNGGHDGNLHDADNVDLNDSHSLAKNVESGQSTAVSHAGDADTPLTRKEDIGETDHEESSLTGSAIVLEDSPEDLASLKADAAMIERALENDMDAAQELESQFGNLAEMTKMFTQSVDEQHEMVNTIQEDTEDAKDFLDKGVHELNSAQVGRSKHFLSIVFLVLSFVLLFLDWFTP